MDKIRAEIAVCGVISFADFMRSALYCPVYGYYETQKDRIGARGDFYTSTSVGPLFGQLLAFQFCLWFDASPAASAPRLSIVEAGAHDGTLARDILTWIRDHRPDHYQRLEYCIVEPSPRRQQWQKETLSGFPVR